MMMKKINFILVFLAFVWQANAEGIVADNVSIMKGNQALVSINYEFNETNNDVYAGYEFKLDMPEGITLLKDANGNVVFNLDTQNSNFNVNSTADGGFGALPRYTNSTSTLKGKSGSLLSVTFIADPSLAVGTEHSVKITDVKLSKRESNGNWTTVKYDDFTFTVTIVENLVTLSENATEAPEPSNGVNVQVNRTINANEWSTICLPFAMDADQVKAVFGDDVIIGDFQGHKADFEGRTTTSIEVKFSQVYTIDANHPYIIKISKEGGISSFLVENVNIVTENELINSQGESARLYSDMIGTYKKDTTVPKDCLFLNGNKFWYSKGNTKMKGFRAYFSLCDVLSDMEIDNTNSNVTLSFDEADGINNVTVGQPVEGIYDIQGRKVHTDENKPLKKGVYIINGKKVVK